MAERERTYRESIGGAVRNWFIVFTAVSIPFAPELAIPLAITAAGGEALRRNGEKARKMEAGQVYSLSAA